MSVFEHHTEHRIRRRQKEGIFFRKEQEEVHAKTFRFIDSNLSLSRMKKKEEEKYKSVP
jgi:hypothetical protein